MKIYIITEDYPNVKYVCTSYNSLTGSNRQVFVHKEDAEEELRECLAETDAHSKYTYTLHELEI